MPLRHRFPVENQHKRVFGVVVYFAHCHQCQSWVCSSWGQFCWLDKTSRNRVSRAHRLAHAVQTEKAA